jgi:2-polyprenyl-6-methoxyphenol hydroxylase-like FAD-dependent oxidoreductase
LLLETARELGAETRTNAEVVEIAKDCRSVQLASGEVLQADIIVGADGSQGICRKTFDPHYSLKGSGAMLFKCAFVLVTFCQFSHDIYELVP